MAIWQGRGVTKKYQVKVKGMRVEGLRHDVIGRAMGVKMKWQGGSRHGISSLYRKTHQALTTTKQIKVLKLGEEPMFDEEDECKDEFVNVCSFFMLSKDAPNTFAPFLVSFLIFCGESESSTSSSRKTKMEIIGKVQLNLGELVSKMEAQIEQKIPVTLQVDGFAMVATFRVVVSFVEMWNSSHSRTTSHDSLTVGLGDSTVMFRRAMSQGPSSLAQEKGKRNKFWLFRKRSSSRNLDEPSTSSNSGSEYVVVASSSKNGEPNIMNELGGFPSSEAQLDMVKKGGFWKWKRRKSKKLEFSDSILGEPEKRGNSWEAKELVSRDGKTKLKADVFFASYDQRSEKAAGESACAVIVAVIAHWLLLNPGMMPTGPELDHLITEGSKEWRKLCEDESHREFFPDQHFDLETIIEAQLRPLAVHPSSSRFGFFHPKEFEHLKDAPSFDDIWDEINKSVNQYEPRVYIVRWNDHFFILKVEADANYIIDSLGERLYEGCKQAYILKFDDSTTMYENDEEKGGGSEMKMNEGREDKMICSEKECCREYMKRFQAAIPLRELKEVEEKGNTVDAVSLYQRLQIDFHLSTPSSSSAASTANTSVSASPNTSPLP